MIRLIPAFFTFVILTFGVAVGSNAGEPVAVVMAQIPHMSRGPGMYLNLFKFIPVVLIFLLWARTTDWVEHDTKELNNLRFGLWNSVVFFSGALGLVLALAIPIYPLGLGLLLLAYLVPIMTYVYARNQTVPDDQKVMTPYHFGEVANDLMYKLGMKPLFNRDMGTVDRAGPPQEPGRRQGRSVADSPGGRVSVVHGCERTGLRRRDEAGDRYSP
jgi:general secretion pathway protein E